MPIRASTTMEEPPSIKKAIGGLNSANKVQGRAINMFDFHVWGNVEENTNIEVRCFRFLGHIGENANIEVGMFALWKILENTQISKLDFSCFKK